ncbi:MAG: hypothetical protein JXB24_13735 [Bacteroidales bacterium]|nr:hypothetical protein [Bacteroidales bacterium]
MKLYFVSPLLIFLLFSGCFTISYSTKGGSLNPNLETVSVQYFANRATRVNPTLSQKFTDGLKEFLESNTKLRVVNTIGDVDFSGEIKNYQINLEAVAAGDIAAKTRFTIAIRVKYTNSINPDDNFDTSFSAFRVFDSSQNFTSVEEELTEEIIDEILDKIYNKAFVNW